MKFYYNSPAGVQGTSAISTVKQLPHHPSTANLLPIFSSDEAFFLSLHQPHQTTTTYGPADHRSSTIHLSLSTSNELSHPSTTTLHVLFPSSKSRISQVAASALSVLKLKRDSLRQLIPFFHVYFPVGKRG